MRIKNTRELRLRANAHTRADHVLQGTYGKGKVNGHAEYRGCAIGCLSTPHRKHDLIAFLRSTLNLNPEPDGWKPVVGGSGEPMRTALETEFGITNRLAIIAEGAFEAQITHAEAIEFIRDFAHALPEGVDIRERDAEAFLRSQRMPTYGAYGRISERLRKPGYWHRRRRAAKNERQRVEDFTTAFLTWLRSGARVSAMPQPVAA